MEKGQSRRVRRRVYADCRATVLVDAGKRTEEAVGKSEWSADSTAVGCYVRTLVYHLHIDAATLKLFGMFAYVKSAYAIVESTPEVTASLAV